jgi:hypothetical protein
MITDPDPPDPSIAGEVAGGAGADGSAPRLDRDTASPMLIAAATTRPVRVERRGQDGASRFERSARIPKLARPSCYSTVVE